MAESETHVAVSHEAEPEPEHESHEEAAAAAVATAGAAVALAHETAAHAELQAAEEVAEIEEEVDEWQTQTLASISNLSANLLRASERIEELGQLEETRHARDEEWSARLAALEAHPSLRSTPPASEATEAEETTASEEAPTENEEEAHRLAGAGANVQLGPAAVESSASLQNPLSPSEEQPRKRKRHWI